MAQVVNNLAAMTETWVQSLGWDDSLEKGNTPVFWPGEFHELYVPWGLENSMDCIVPEIAKIRT